VSFPTSTFWNGSSTTLSQASHHGIKSHLSSRLQANFDLIQTVTQLSIFRMGPPVVLYVEVYCTDRILYLYSTVQHDSVQYSIQYRTVQYTLHGTYYNVLIVQ